MAPHGGLSVVSRKRVSGRDERGAPPSAVTMMRIYFVCRPLMPLNPLSELNCTAPSSAGEIAYNAQRHDGKQQTKHGDLTAQGLRAGGLWAAALTMMRIYFVCRPLMPLNPLSELNCTAPSSAGEIAYNAQRHDGKQQTKHGYLTAQGLRAGGLWAAALTMMRIYFVCRPLMPLNPLSELNCTAPSSAGEIAYNAQRHDGKQQTKHGYLTAQGLRAGGLWAAALTMMRIYFVCRPLMPLNPLSELNCTAPSSAGEIAYNAQRRDEKQQTKHGYLTARGLRAGLDGCGELHWTVVESGTFDTKGGLYWSGGLSSSAV